MSPRLRILLGLLAAAIVALLAAYSLTPRSAPPPETGSASSDGGADGRKVTWDYSVWGASRSATSGAEKIEELFEAAAPERFEMTIHYGSAAAPPAEGLDAVQVGALEGAQICAGYHPNKLPLATTLELPMLLTRDIAVNARVIDAVMSHPLLQQELAEKWNAKYLLPVLVTRYEFMGTRRIGSVADLQGVRVRISGANALLLEEFGAVPTMVTAPETYTALSRGTLDVVGLPYAEALGVYRIHEVSDYTTDGFAMSGFACFTIVSQKAWEALPAKLKAMWPEVKETAIQTMIDSYAAGDREWIPVFEERLEVVPFPEAERRKLQAAARPIWEDWVQKQEAKGLPAREVLELILAEVERHSAE